MTMNNQPAQRPQQFGGGMGSANMSSVQMQNFIKSFYELVKKGDIDAVIHEIQNRGIDVSNLQDENAFKQTAMFSVGHIPDDRVAVRMAQVLKENNLNPC